MEEENKSSNSLAALALENDIIKQFPSEVPDDYAQVNQGKNGDPDVQINLVQNTENTSREPLNHGIDVNKVTE